MVYFLREEKEGNIISSVKERSVISSERKVNGSWRPRSVDASLSQMARAALGRPRTRCNVPEPCPPPPEPRQPGKTRGVPITSPFSWILGVATAVKPPPGRAGRQGTVVVAPLARCSPSRPANRPHRGMKISSQCWQLFASCYLVVGPDHGRHGSPPRVVSGDPLHTARHVIPLLARGTVRSAETFLPEWRPVVERPGVSARGISRRTRALDVDMAGRTAVRSAPNARSPSVSAYEFRTLARNPDGRPPSGITTRVGESTSWRAASPDRRPGVLATRTKRLARLRMNYARREKDSSVDGRILKNI